MWFWKPVKQPDGRTVYQATNICEVCSTEYRSDNAATSKYCPICSKRISAEKNRERVRKFREKQKLSLNNI